MDIHTSICLYLHKYACTFFQVVGFVAEYVLESFLVTVNKYMQISIYISIYIQTYIHTNIYSYMHIFSDCVLCG